MASTTIIENVKLDTKTYLLNKSETPSPTGPSDQISPSTMSTTWLKLNSTAPIHVELGGATEIPTDEPFSGAKKLRWLLEKTDEIIVCPGVYDGLSARTAIELGFKSLYMVSYLWKKKTLNFYGICSLYIGHIQYGGQILKPRLTQRVFFFSPHADWCRNDSFATWST